MSITPSIAASPATGSATNPSFAFTGEGGATQECRLMKAAAVVAGWAPCTSPRAYALAGETDGVFTFSVRSVDDAQNVGAIASQTREARKHTYTVPARG